ncbi:CRISPR-associated endoribonuclease Cas6 [Lyngbya sp. PCC 8106]|uniref:CRISPR-associated endoribonuclease Cas6 n=1 Tax=Lyngbya sp. (strain PCC 8106) TaxID=313612 RepID=UPI0000EAC6BF|nr:CRISPR-associated endoribonuclease Cas6 [Lyngbya sp. PCC 8106]EAW34718.1 CRISPR-associated protein [Lyngbya sp. PCC 8106]
MPYSLVLNLIPLSSISPTYLSGRHLHALFLTLVSSVDKQLGDYLHEPKTEKSFTLSPLQTCSKHRRVEQTLQWEHSQPISVGTPCWWRISLLDEGLFSKLTHLWLNLNPDQPWHLGSANLKITSVLATPQSTQPWANTCSYSQLYQQASNSDRSMTLIFCTPTAFRQGKFDTSLPTAEIIFNSLLNRWNKYSGIEFKQLPLNSIFPSFFNIKTEMVADSRSKFIGCVGKVNYRLLGNVEPEIIQQVNTLADFAFYCGVGRKTPMGMGMLRRLQKEGTGDRGQGTESLRRL